MQAILQDVFDSDLHEELKDLYSSKVWSEVSDDLKFEMKDKIKNNLLACNMEVTI
jgi:hypothetical protein